MEATTAQSSIGRPAVPARFALRVLRWIAACLMALAAVAAGIGVLYLLRSEGSPAIGPRIPGALPLQQLAGGEAQPLLRMVIAWVPAGLVAGLGFVRLTGLASRVRAVYLAALAAIVLLLAGAAADAIAITDPLGPHLLPQLTRLGTWTAVALFASGSLIADRVRPEAGQS
jgi:hypothetical protein